jgi:Tol biopolymer transport system component
MPGIYSPIARSFWLVVACVITVSGCSHQPTRPLRCLPGALFSSLDVWPAWSPNGTVIAYLRAARTPSDSFAVYAVGLADTISAKILGLEQDPYASDLSYSPGGTQLLLYYKLDIWTIDLQQVGLRRWTSSPGRARWPTWSHDGRYILFCITSRAVSDPDTAAGLHLIDMTDGSIRAFVHGAGLATLTSGPAQFSPDGTQIVFPFTVTAGRTFDLFMVNSDGSGYRRLTYVDGAALNPQWSSDGSRIFFDYTPAGCNPASAGNRTTWVLDTSGGNPRQWSVILGDPRVQFGFPCRFANLKVAFTGLDLTGTQGVVWIENIDGSGKRQLTFP